jgi:hypothetical protein
MLAAGPFVREPPEQDPFVDLLLRPEVGGALLAGTIVCLLVAVWIRRRLKGRDDDFGPEPTLPEEKEGS